MGEIKQGESMHQCLALEETPVIDFEEKVTSMKENLSAIRDTCIDIIPEYGKQWQIVENQFKEPKKPKEKVEMPELNEFNSRLRSNLY